MRPTRFCEYEGVARALEADGDAQDDRGDYEHCDRGEREGDVEGALHEAVGEAAVGALGDGDGPLGLGDQLGGQERHVGSGHRLRIPEGFARLYITALIGGRGGGMMGGVTVTPWLIGFGVFDIESACDRKMKSILL